MYNPEIFISESFVSAFEDFDNFSISFFICADVGFSFPEAANFLLAASYNFLSKLPSELPLILFTIFTPFKLSIYENELRQF